MDLSNHYNGVRLLRTAIQYRELIMVGYLTENEAFKLYDFVDEMRFADFKKYLILKYSETYNTHQKLIWSNGTEKQPGKHSTISLYSDMKTAIERSMLEFAQGNSARLGISVQNRMGVLHAGEWIKNKDRMLSNLIEQYDVVDIRNLDTGEIYVEDSLLSKAESDEQSNLYNFADNINSHYNGLDGWHSSFSNCRDNDL